MKKLMIAAAIVCAAAMSQAASIAWNINDAKATDADKMMVYLVSVADATAGFKTIDEVKSANTAFKGEKGTGAFSGQIVKGARGGESLSAGAANEDWADGDTVSFAMIVVDTDEGGYWSTGAMSATAKGSGAPAAAVFSTLGSLTAGTRTDFQAAPEPTSGMLLLLGVAGLALKRRRA